MSFGNFCKRLAVGTGSLALGLAGFGMTAVGVAVTFSVLPFFLVTAIIGGIAAGVGAVAKNEKEIGLAMLAGAAVGLFPVSALGVAAMHYGRKGFESALNLDGPANMNNNKNDASSTPNLYPPRLR